MSNKKSLTIKSKRQWQRFKRAYKGDDPLHIKKFIKTENIPDPYQARYLKAEDKIEWNRLMLREAKKRKKALDEMIADFKNRGMDVDYTPASKFYEDNLKNLKQIRLMTKPQLDRTYRELYDFITARTSTPDKYLKSIEFNAKKVQETIINDKIKKYTEAQDSELKLKMETMSTKRYNKFVEETTKNIKEKAIKEVGTITFTPEIYDKMWKLYDKFENSQKELRYGDLMAAIYEIVTENSTLDVDVLFNMLQNPEDYKKRNIGIDGIDV